MSINRIREIRLGLRPIEVNTNDPADLTRVIDELTGLIEWGKANQQYGDNYVTYRRYCEWAGPLVEWFRELRETVPVAAG
jgi:hypothetical protein